jgi:hypothetical protein
MLDILTSKLQSYSLLFVCAIIIYGDFFLSSAAWGFLRIKRRGKLSAFIRVLPLMVRGLNGFGRIQNG